MRKIKERNLTKGITTIISLITTILLLSCSSNSWEKEFKEISVISREELRFYEDSAQQVTVLGYGRRGSSYLVIIEVENRLSSPVLLREQFFLRIDSNQELKEKELLVPVNKALVAQEKRSLADLSPGEILPAKSSTVGILAFSLPSEVTPSTLILTYPDADNNLYEWSLRHDSEE